MNTKQLFLGEFESLTQEEAKSKIVSDFEIQETELKRFKIMIAYQDYADYEGQSFILLKDKETGELFENHGSHCSCYGFEGQFDPKKTEMIYLLSEHFSCYSFGNEKKLIQDFLKKYNQKLYKS